MARYYQTISRVHQRSQEIEQKERLLNFERYWKIVVTPYLQKGFPLDEELNSAEIDRLLHLIAEEFADVPAIDWKRSGPGSMFVELTPFGQPKTYGEMAAAIRKVWNGQQGIPRFILLDVKQVIQPVALHRFSTLEEFEQSIDTLLKSIPSSKPPSP